MTTASHACPCHPHVVVAALFWPLTRPPGLRFVAHCPIVTAALLCTGWGFIVLLLIRGEFILNDLGTEGSASFLLLQGMKESLCHDRKSLSECEKRTSDITSLGCTGMHSTKEEII